MLRESAESGNYPAPAYGPGFSFATVPPSRTIPPAPRDAAIIQDWLTADEGRSEQCIECELDIDFGREQIVKVLSVISVIWRFSKSKQPIDGKFLFSKEAQAQWVKVAQEYADDLPDYELTYLLDKVRASVAMTGGEDAAIRGQL